MKIKYLLLALLLPFLSYAQSTPKEESTDLKILSWNIHMLPYFIFNTTKKQKRAKQIIAELNERDYNILVLQEAFHARINRKIKRNLKRKYPYSYGPANKKLISAKTNSGIWILSDRPLHNRQELVYNDCEGDGCLARKGVLMMEGEHEGNPFQVFGTHMNGGPINEGQFKQTKEELLDVFEKEGVPLFICGDFNTKKSSPADLWNKMLHFFEVKTEPMQVDKRSKKHKENWPIVEVYESWPDFIFVKPNNCSNLNIKGLATISIGPTWKQGKMKKYYPETVGLSDHYPVEVIVSWSDQ